MLLIENEVNKISPTALMKSITSPYTYWFEKLSKDYTIPRDPQSLAAGVGTWFDVLVKKALIHKGVESSLSVEKIEDSLEVKDPETMLIGEKIFEEYKKAGFLRDTEFKRVEIHKDYPYRGLKLSGQLDATVIKDGKEIVLDFKVSGAGSKTGVSPKPGYVGMYRTGLTFGEESSRKIKTGWEGGHKKQGIPFDEIDIKWATQFCFYSWLLEPEKAGEIEFDVVVHSPIFNGKSKQLCFVIYEGKLTIEFQQKVLEAVDNFINKIISGEWCSAIRNPVVLRTGPEDIEMEIAYTLAMGESWMTKLPI